MHIHKLTRTEPAGKELGDLVLELYEAVADHINKSHYRRTTRNVEDAFMVVAGHIVFAVAERRSQLNEIPVHHLIEDLCAVIEMNAMEMNLKTWKEDNGPKP